MALTHDLELAFRKAWFLLYAQGVQAGYVAALTTFIQAASTAYRQGYTLEALNLELTADQKRTGNPQIDELILLNDDEVQIRSTWLVLVYMTLDRTRPRNLDQPPLEREGLNDLVNGVIESHQRGYTIETLKFELMFETSGTQRTPGEVAIFSQWMRIVFLTLALPSLE